MNAVLVWALIAVSDGAYNRGNVSVVAYFSTMESCEQVRKNIPVTAYAAAMRCIQGEYLLSPGKK